MKFRSYSSVIIYLSICVLLIEGFGGLARAGSFSGFKSVKSGQKKNTESRLADNSKQLNSGGEIKSAKSTKSRSYLSAWGIISLIMLIVVGSLLVYYVSIFYPLVCAERGKYDVMEMTSV